MGARYIFVAIAGIILSKRRGIKEFGRKSSEKGLKNKDNVIYL